MTGLDIENVVVVFKRHGEFHWYRGNRDWWVLDWNKWEQDFADAGIDDPHESTAEERFGILVVNNETMTLFLNAVEESKISKDDLAIELNQRFPKANSWWDVGDLFPIMFIDCDKQRVIAFYPCGTPMERYVPDDWQGEFEDFASTLSEVEFPSSEKFWVQNGVDMLSELNRRGQKVADQQRKCD